jgi:hypothetical protein
MKEEKYPKWFLPSIRSGVRLSSPAPFYGVDSQPLCFSKFFGLTAPVIFWMGGFLSPAAANRLKASTLVVLLAAISNWSSTFAGVESDDLE